MNKSIKDILATWKSRHLIARAQPTGPQQRRVIDRAKGRINSMKAGVQKRRESGDTQDLSARIDRIAKKEAAVERIEKRFRREKDGLALAIESVELFLITVDAYTDNWEARVFWHFVQLPFLCLPGSDDDCCIFGHKDATPDIAWFHENLSRWNYVVWMMAQELGLVPMLREQIQADIDGPSKTDESGRIRGEELEREFAHWLLAEFLTPEAPEVSDLHRGNYGKLPV